MQMNIIANKHELKVNSLELELSDLSTLPILQNRLDIAEKSGQPNFHDFTDADMMKWFLYERKHLNMKNGRTEKTITEYKRELMLFVEQLLTNSAEINVDMDYIIEGSLFKSLQSRHLRRYQEWLATESDLCKKKWQILTRNVRKKNNHY